MLLLQLFINGLATGALYALTAVGFALIYNGTRIFHIAHGAVFTFGGYALYLFAVPLGLPWVVALPAALLATSSPVAWTAGAVLALLGLWIYEDLWVRAGQSIPLS